MGLIIGLVAVGTAIFQDELRPPPPEDNRTLTEVAGEAARNLIREKLLREDDGKPALPSTPENQRDVIVITYMALGFAAMALGLTSWIRKEHIRLSGGAIALGLIAVGWEYVLIGILIAVVILIVSHISSLNLE